MSRWIIVLPPEGGARLVARQAAAAAAQLLPEGSLKVFDSLSWRTALRQLLAKPDDDLVVDLLNQQLVVQCLDFGATGVLVGALSPVTAFSLGLLRRQRILTVHWFYEDYRRAGYWRDVLPAYDVFCAIQRGPLEQECRRHGVRYLLLHTAAAGDSAGPQEAPSERAHDVAFVGIPSPYRIAILERLAAEGIDLVIAGQGWDRCAGPLRRAVAAGAWVEGRELSRILLSARVGINLSVDPPAAQCADTHLSPRVYDVLLHRLSLVTEDVPLCHECLAGMHYRTFSVHDDRQAVVAVREALASFDAEAHTREADRLRVLAAHTYANRLQAIFALQNGRAWQYPAGALTLPCRTRTDN